MCLLINMLLNIDGAIPAAILLVLHFLLGISLWWSVLALAVWLAWILLYMLVIGWARDCGNTADEYRENKNPYSQGSGKKR